MSKQKVLTIAGVALLIVLVIVAFTFKGKYDDASALLIAKQAEATEQKAASDAEIEALNGQITELQASLEEAAAQAAALTEEKTAAEQKVAELEESAKAAADSANADLAAVQAELAAATGKLDAISAELIAAEEELSAAKEALEAAETKLTESDQAASDAAAQIAALTEEKAALEIVIEELTAPPAEEVEAVTARYESSRTGIALELPEGAEVSETWRKVTVTLADGRAIDLWIADGAITAKWTGELDDTAAQILSSAKILASKEE